MTLGKLSVLSRQWRFIKHDVLEFLVQRSPGFAPVRLAVELGLQGHAAPARIFFRTLLCRKLRFNTRAATSLDAVSHSWYSWT